MSYSKSSTHCRSSGHSSSHTAHLTASVRVASPTTAMSTWSCARMYGNVCATWQYVGLSLTATITP
eukprot:3213063-Rhodomonas_salina.2